MMKKTQRILGLTLALGALIFASSCGEDDPIVIIDDTPADGGFAVADGIYLAGLSGSDTTIVNAAVLSSVEVEGPDFGTIARSGHFASYIYLNSGDYFFAEVDERSVINTFGGAVTQETSDVGGELAAYNLVALESGGASFSISNEGLYHVVYDAQSSEGIFTEIGSWGIIGSGVFKSACESDGFDADLDLMEVAVNADGASWESTDILLKGGKVKIRYNDAWKIERRSTIDPDDPYNPANGYVALTNFGGTADALEAGGSDFDIPDGDGKYTVNVTLDEGEVSMDFTRTGESEECAFDADNFKFGVLGSAVDGDDLDASGTPDGWEQNDRNFFYKGNVEGVDTWLGIVSFEDVPEGKFKFRTNDEWTFSLGGTLTADGTESTLEPSGADFDSPGAGMYYITITTPDQGATWNATMVENGWAVTGAATPNGWANDDSSDDPIGVDHNLMPQGTVEGVTTYTITLDMIVDQYKFRANDAWDYNIGGDASNLSPDGDNLSIATAGTYLITLSYDGDTYSTTAELQ